jgi:hypothetical protein
MIDEMGALRFDSVRAGAGNKNFGIWMISVSMFGTNARRLSVGKGESPHQCHSVSAGKTDGILTIK